MPESYVFECRNFLLELFTQQLVFWRNAMLQRACLT